MADYTVLDLIPQFAKQEHGEGWSHLLWNAHPVINPNGHITLTHVILSAFAMIVIVILALIARGKYADKETALIPEGKFSIRNFFEVIFDGLYDVMEGMMGKEYTKQFFPLIAGLAIYILIQNLMGLIPGFVPPTQNMNTNVAMSLVVFIFYNYVGFREQGLNYAKHFLGPMMLIAPMILAIELFGHAFRPVSLAVRLAGNMTGDHAVLGVFSEIAGNITGGFPLFLPIPFLALGLLVSIVQTVVFCLLTSIYIALAVHHDEDDHH